MFLGSCVRGKEIISVRELKIKGSLRSEHLWNIFKLVVSSSREYTALGSKRTLLRGQMRFLLQAILDLKKVAMHPELRNNLAEYVDFVPYRSFFFI